MDFDFAFLSLKQLSMISYGRHLVSEKLGFRMWPPPMILPPDFDEVVSQLLIPRGLKFDLFAILTGMYNETLDWLQRLMKFRLPYNELEPIFDVYGMFDEFRTWEQYFETKLDSQVPGGILRLLLLVACSRTLLPQISMVLHRILQIEANEDTRLTGPRKEIVNNKLILVYKLVNSEKQLSDYEDLSGLNDTSWNNATFEMNGREIKISLDSMVNIHSFWTYFVLLDPSQRTRCLQTFLVRFHKSYVTMGFVVNFLKLFSHDDQLICLSTTAASFDVLYRLLRWPMTPFFLPLLSVLRGRRLGVSEYRALFKSIVAKIPDQPKFDDVYGDLISEFWSLIPLNEKKRFMGDGQHVTETMQQLSQKKPDAHAAIDEEIRQLPPPTDGCSIV